MSTRYKDDWRVWPHEDGCVTVLDDAGKHLIERDGDGFVSGGERFEALDDAIYARIGDPLWVQGDDE